MRITELGRPVACTALPEGTPVYAPDGDRIGVVEHVVADEPVDVFEGLVVHTLPLPGKHLFADADQIEELRERGVLLRVGRSALHDPAPRRRTAGEPGPAENPLQARLRRAWDWVLAHVEAPR
ncbi:PRC-barrel domain-containing protein [Lentzea sp. HUAS12]|uniref:PRC-barrel domain-containing protein n=1 Tax=Lentzea sp. HUAS12 TaxID=2951806 RepID=UPI00209FF0EE|nr:PRC-barrel domain-containing protein [Lentzea sp. HUAS12]USX53783.1 PRC-barrel domain-containing protein [Lentzea sp. HUAS12]